MKTKTQRDYERVIMSLGCPALLLAEWDREQAEKTANDRRGRSRAYSSASTVYFPCTISLKFW